MFSHLLGVIVAAICVCESKADCVCNTETQTAVCRDPAGLSDLVGCEATKTLYFAAHSFGSFCCTKRKSGTADACGDCLMKNVPNLEKIIISEADSACCFQRYCGCVQNITYTAEPVHCAEWYVFFCFTYVFCLFVNVFFDLVRFR